MLASVRPVDGVVAERKRQARELLADVRRLDADIKDTKARIMLAVEASKTCLTDIYGVGPIVAALVIGHTGDVRHFASRHQIASYNGSAPIEASGPKKRHRLNRGNRQLNALHIAAICQIRFDTPGRDEYLRKVEEGKTKKEAIRSLKRRLSDAVYCQLPGRRRTRHRPPHRNATRGTPAMGSTSSRRGGYPRRRRALAAPPPHQPLR